MSAGIISTNIDLLYSTTATSLGAVTNAVSNIDLTKYKFILIYTEQGSFLKDNSSSFEIRADTAFSSSGLYKLAYFKRSFTVTENSISFSTCTRYALGNTSSEWTNRLVPKRIYGIKRFGGDI